jgi:hypothetical protein
MKIIKQISTGKTVHREVPHTNNTLSNASAITEIVIADLQVVDDDITEEQYATRSLDELPWEDKMRRSDTLYMPRYLEDLITDKFDGNAGPNLQVRYDDKVALRATKPKE